MDNPYKLAPLKLFVLDVVNGGKSTYIFLGDVPKKILDAANTYNFKTSKWDAKASKLLKHFYGYRWNKILCPKTRKLYSGGDIDNFGDFDDITFDAADDMSSAASKPIFADIDTGDDYPQSSDPKIIYTNITIYPEDTLEDVKNKITVVTKIQYCKQHMFYYHNGHLTTTYNMSIEESPIRPNIVKTAGFIKHQSEDMDYISGIPIDKQIEENKFDLTIEPRDMFRNMYGHGDIIQNLYVVNIDVVLNYVENDIKKIARDKYQLDLFYYGFVIKFWPTFSVDAFKTLILHPKQMDVQYPYLFRPIRRLKQIIHSEQEIIDGIYNRSKETKLRQQEIEDYEGIAVTRAKIFVTPKEIRSLINIRNIFDMVRATHQIPAILANLQAFDMGVTNQRSDYVLEKTHISAASYRYGPGSSKDLDKFLEKPLSKHGIAFVLVKDKAPMNNVLTRKPHFIYLTVYFDGNYTIESSWNEVDRVNFAGIVAQLSRVISPIVDIINKYKNITLPLGNPIELPNKNKVKLGSLVVNTYWPHALTDIGFKNLKVKLKKYEEAGIIQIRSIQQPGVYAFYFKKNIIQYNSKFIDFTLSKRLFASGVKNSVNNKYNYLTNPDIKNIWNNIYNGRMVKFYQKSTLLKVEIMNVDIDEFKFINTYMLTFLDSLIYGDTKISGIVNPNEKQENKGRLRSLQEQDPNLYNFRQFDSGATVYSVLCQGERQPEIITKKESRKYKKSEITKFWNFTEQRSAYYRCPSKKFPYLQFSVGKHPLGYCLPCCKKTKITTNSKASIKTQECMTNFKTDPSDIKISQNTRHILTYGKSTIVGRISYTPSELADSLLYKSLEHPFVYRLIGVVQHTLTMPKAGFFYALASAFEYESHDFVKELVETVIALEDSYGGLADGAASIFKTAAELIETIVDTFIYIEGGPSFSAFGPGGSAHESWKAIIVALVRIRFDIEIIEFIDVYPGSSTGESDDGAGLNRFSMDTYTIGDDVIRLGSGGNMEFVADAIAVNKLKNSKDIPCNIAIIVTNELGSYPFVAMDQKAFMKHTRGYGPARRFFSSHYSEDDFSDTVVKSLREMLLSEVKYKCLGPNKYLDLDTITTMCEQNDYLIEYQLVNLRSMCYGVIINTGTDESIYFPIPYSPYFLKPKVEGKSASFVYYGSRPTDRKYSPAALDKVFKKFAPVLGLQVRYKMEMGGKVIGFICDYECVKSYTLTFYHDAISHSDVKKYSWSNAPITNIPYDIGKIDAEIYDSHGMPNHTLPSDKMSIMDKGEYKNNLYDLFVTEFVASINHNRNKPMRTKLITLVKASKFDSTGNIIDFIKKMTKLLDGYSKDIHTIKMFMTQYKMTQKIRPLLQTDIEANVFGFDRMVVNRLREMKSKHEIEQELARIMKNKVHFVSSVDGIKINNIYVACSVGGSGSSTGDNQDQCEGKKLKICKSKYKAFISILAADILNPNKIDTLYLLTSGVIDKFKFSTTMGEIIKIKNN